MMRGPPEPGTLSYRILDRLFLSHRGLRVTREALATGTRLINEFTRPPGRDLAEAPRALVFLLRAQSYWVHHLHHYLVGCALRGLGYRVGFVVCTGGVEHCGMDQENVPTLAPPLACGACRKVTRAASREGFDWINLNDFKGSEAAEEEYLDTQTADPETRRLLEEALRPFLRRYYFGDERKIHPAAPTNAAHRRAGLRYLFRFRRLLDQVRPACLCLFNGLIFPECLLFREARARGVTVLCTERGLKKNTVFLSVNEPACHYRSERLWARERDRITSEQLAEAEAYLARRLAAPENPHGIPRDLLDDDEEKYRRLAKDPFVVFFAPVTHDTACMDIEGPAGGLAQVLEALCRYAIRYWKKLVIRSHPDERYPINPSRYPVRQFLEERRLRDNDCVTCLDASEKWNPYTLARHADAVVLYNGTLAMELAALGHKVFNLAASHYSHKGFTDDLGGPDDFARIFASVRERLTPAEQEAALRYLYYYVFVAALPVDGFFDESSESPTRGLEAAVLSRRPDQFGRIKERAAFLLGSAGVTLP